MLPLLLLAAAIAPCIAFGTYIAVWVGYGCTGDLASVDDTEITNSLTVIEHDRALLHKHWE